MVNSFYYYADFLLGCLSRLLSYHTVFFVEILFFLVSFLFSVSSYASH